MIQIWSKLNFISFGCALNLLRSVLDLLYWYSTSESYLYWYSTYYYSVRLGVRGKWI